MWEKKKKKCICIRGDLYCSRLTAAAEVEAEAEAAIATGRHGSPRACTFPLAAAAAAAVGASQQSAVSYSDSLLRPA